MNKPTDEQYREQAVKFVRNGVPLRAVSQPGNVVKRLAPAAGAPGAYVNVDVWIPEHDVVLPGIIESDPEDGIELGGESGCEASA